MKKLCAEGYRISAPDRKALEAYLLVTPSEWSISALAGMKNKAIKSIMRDWFEVYKAKQTGDIPADYAIVIPAIIAMEEFKPYNVGTPEVPQIGRIMAVSEEIWPGGFDVEDYEKDALEAFYEHPEEMLRYFMHNKIHARRKAFVKEHEKGFFERKEAIPSKQDDFINVVCAKVGYKNRVTREAEQVL